MDRIIDQCIRRLEECERKARETKRKWPHDARNTLAVEASEGNVNLAKELKIIPKGQVYEKLGYKYGHCKYWNGKFAEYANAPFQGHRNGYARDCHKEGMEAFLDAMNAIKKLEKEGVTSTKFHLKRLFGSEGGCNGTQVLKFRKGFTTNKHVSSDLKASISASVGGPMKSFTGSFESSVESKLANSFEVNEYQDAEHQLTIHLDMPCYVYQVVGTFATKTQGLFEIAGNLEIFNHDIEAEATASLQKR